MEDWNKKLIEAAVNGRVEELKLCLANGANIDNQEGGGWTALMLAARWGHVEVSRLLLENKCNKDITNDNGYTALMLAAMWGHVEVSRLLLENKCNKDITNVDGLTALMLAARYGRVEVSRLLLENKCNKDITDSDGRTALHLAAEWGRLQITRCLVEEGGISPFVKTHEGKTPYDLAAAEVIGSNKEVMEYLQGIYRSQKKLSALTDSLKSVASTKFSSLNPENTTVVTPWIKSCSLAQEKRSPTKKRSRECLTPVKSGYTPHGKKPLPASSQTPKARRKRLNFNKTPRQTPKSTRKSPVSPGPKVKVHLGFKGSSRQTTLKGSSKLACRAIVLKQYKTAINHLLQIEDLKKDIFQITKKKMSQELQQICQAKESVLRTKNLEKFSWKKAYNELKQTCPLVTELMLLIVGNKNKQIPRIVSSIAILLFNRNSQMGAIQAINSILMFRGHIRTKVYTTFNRAGLCSSYKSSIRHVDQICQNFDQPVRNWANRVASHYTKKLKETAHLDEHNYALSSLEDHTSCSTTLPVLETPAKGHTGTNPVKLFCESPFEFSTPESESPTYMYTAVPVSPLSETPRTSLTCNDLDTPDRTSEEVFTESPYTTVMATETDEISSFQIVMDNLNMMTKVRHKTEDTSNKMHNLVHALAVQDRVSADDLEECVPQADILTIPNEAFLPSKVDYTQLKQEYNILIQRVLVENIIELKECKEFVIYHIPHQFSKESRKKSCVIPLGILEKDENKTEEMIEIIEHLQQYTPKAHDKMMPLLMGGDGLSVERGEGAQRARADGISQEDRLEGFIWKSEDWHAHVISLQDTFNQLFKGTSSPEKGTLFQLRNLFEHRGVKSEVKDAVNSCRDFLRFVTQGYVILAALNVLNMHSVNDIEESLSTKTKGEKKTFMENLSKNIVSKFLQTETPSLKQKGHGNKINKENRVPCGFPGCQKTFFREGKCRLNHRAICPYRHLTDLSVPDEETDLDQQSTSNHSEEQQEKPDYKFNYSCCLLREGLQDWIREDSSKENDGDRLVRMWRFDFLRFSLYNHTKYRLLAFRLQVQLMALLPPKLAHQLRHNRCINIHGVEGCNVPADQALEFLNMRAKDALNSLHGNMSSASIQRCGRSLQGCNDIIDSYTRGLDQYFGKPKNSKPSMKKDISKLVEHLGSENLFATVPGRHHRSFPTIKSDPLEKLDGCKLNQWLTEKRESFARTQRLRSYFVQ